MATTEQILKEEFDLLVVDLIAKHKELGMSASNKWIETIESKVTPVSGVILAQDYTEYLVNGRKAGKFPPIDAIKKWIIDKGISSDLPINSLAFVIARSIARKGTKYFQQGGTDLLDAVLTPRRISNIIDRLGSSMTVKVLETLGETFETV